MRGVGLAAGAFAVLSAAAHAQEVKDGKYENPQLKIGFSLPSKDWGEIKTGGDYAAEFKKGDETVVGYLAISEVESGTKVEAFADEFDKSLSAADGIADFKRLKRGKRADGWLECEYTMKTSGTAVHTVLVFAIQGTSALALLVTTTDESWNDLKGEVAKITGSFQSTEAKAKTETKSNGGADAKSVTVARHLWKGFGKDTTVTYKLISEFGGAKTESLMTYRLVETTEDSYTIETTVETMGQKNTSRHKFLVDPKAPEGSGGGEKPQIESGKETIEVPAGKFDCEWVQTKTAQATSKAWNSDKVPGGLVKSESKMSAGSSTMILEKLDKK